MAAILQAEDIAAIDAYITSRPLNTPAAVAARDAWILWLDGTTLMDRYLDRPTLDRARNLRLAFDLANATSDAERAEIMRKATTGMSTEEMQGEPDRRNSQGRYSETAPMSTAAKAGMSMLAALGLVALAKRVLLK